jgi:murein DD-endopeptidase MepM/ murein hydrolase activator NlpD
MANWMLPFPDSCLTDRFGVWTEQRKKMGLGPHRGVDYGKGVKGKSIPAVTSGKIEKIIEEKGLGWVLVQSNANRTLFIGYCHLREKPAVKVGQTIKMGQRIGFVGNTGTYSSGDHLHATLGPTVDSYKAGTVYDLHGYIVKVIERFEAKKNG